MPSSHEVKGAPALGIELGVEVREGPSNERADCVIDERALELGLRHAGVPRLRPPEECAPLRTTEHAVTRGRARR